MRLEKKALKREYSLVSRSTIGLFLFVYYRYIKLIQRVLRPIRLIRFGSSVVIREKHQLYFKKMMEMGRGGGCPEAGGGPEAGGLQMEAIDIHILSY